MDLHERDTEVLEQILSILKNHPEIEKIEVDEEPMVSLPLREKLYRANPDAPFYIRSVREVGYCLDVDEP